MMDHRANNRLRLRMLRYFQVLARELHFGRAAEMLNISQPPLSLQIKELETILGVALFDRTSRKVSLTRAGVALKAELDRLLEATDKSLDYVRQIGRSENQRLNIGIVGSAVWGPLLSQLNAFKVRNPGVEWQLFELSQHQQREALRRRTIDIAISRNVLPDVDLSLRCRLISRESVLIAIPEGDALCAGDSVALASLAARPFISLSLSQSDFAQQVHDHCVKSGFVPHIAHQVKEPQTALALVGAGAGIALLPETCALIHWPGVIFLPLEETLPADLYAFWYDEEMMPLIRHFIEALTRVIPDDP